MMTVGQVLEQLRTAKNDSVVYFDFADCAPTTVDSWRGIYADPAIGWTPTGYSGDGKAPTVASLIGELEKAIDGRLYTGWKGGDYRYTENSTLHVDNSGDYSQTEIVRIEDREWCVIIHTERDAD